jgi:hypothetical protein
MKRLIPALAVVCVTIPVLCSPSPLRADEPPIAAALVPEVPLPPMPTLGGTQFWADELVFYGWRIQRNVLTGHCRLLDGNQFRHASGTYHECYDKLQEIKLRKGLQPMQGKVVITLHGLGVNRLAMVAIGHYLKKHGDYTVVNVGYPSTRRGIEEHARSLAHVVENLGDVDEISFVAHSLGNIVLRRYLADQTDPATGRRPDPRIKRIVMLGPPNHGAKAADALGENSVFRLVLGDSAGQLGDEWVWTEDSLVAPACEFGVIAGGLGNGYGFNPILPGDDDGVVTVRSTRLAGARDTLVLPLTHTMLLLDPRVHEHTLRFLQQGFFVSERERKPVEDGAE